MDSSTLDIDLNALLSESVRLRNASKNKQGRKRTTKAPEPKATKSRHVTRTSDSTKEDYADAIEDRELRARWLPVSSVAMFNVQRCTFCNSEHSHFQGIFQHQRSQAFTNLERWEASDKIQTPENLPRSQKHNVYITDMCATCIPKRIW